MQAVCQTSIARIIPATRGTNTAKKEKDGTGGSTSQKQAKIARDYDVTTVPTQTSKGGVR